MSLEASIPFAFFLADVYGAVFMFLGTLLFIKTLKKFGGEKFKAPAFMIGAGVLLFSTLHEGGEIICGSGVHGGVPKTLYGTAHILLLCSIGAIIFFIGCYAFERNYNNLIKSMKKIRKRKR